MNITGMFEKHKLLSRVPKEKRADLKIIMSRANFHEARDMGNEAYVLNIIDLDCVEEKRDTEGFLYLMCASSRFEIKMLCYKLRYGDRNEIIVQKKENEMLTEIEECAWDRYIAEFCTAIKRDLHYQVVYSSEVVPAPVQHTPVPVKQVEAAKVSTQTPVQKVEEKAATQKVDNGVTNFSLEQIQKAIAHVGETKVTFTVYTKDGRYGLGIVAGEQTIGDIQIIQSDSLEEVDVVRAMSTSISLAQALGSYIRLYNSNMEVNYILVKDRDIINELIPEKTFTVIDLQSVKATN